MKIKLGANPIGWSNDDMQDIGGDISLETCLEEARDIGFQGMELGHKFPREPNDLTAKLKSFNMELVGGWYSSNLLIQSAEQEITAMQSHLKLLKQCGAKVFIIAETSNAIHSNINIPLSKRPHLTEWQSFGEKMNLLAKETLKHDIRLVYHHHMGTIVQSEADIDNFMKHTNQDVHLLLDTGHATWAGANPAKLAHKYQSRISHLHSKDVRPTIQQLSDKQDWSFLKSVLEGVYTVPSDGQVDYKAVLNELPAFEGWIVIEAEQDPKKANPKNYMTKGFKHLHSLIKTNE